MNIIQTANLDDIQPGLSELAAYIFDGDTATCKVKAEDGFYRSRYNRDHFLKEQLTNHFG